jgi:thioredoxin-dependent peroxiredoxin
MDELHNDSGIDNSIVVGLEYSQNESYNKCMKQAPDFSLQDQSGKTRQLKDYAGKWLVLYFYPKDDTQGCTAQACSFRDGRDDIAQSGKAEVVGVSKDSVASHKKSAQKNHLNFMLLSDPEHSVIEAYDSWKPQKFMGREYLGTQRNTFIISPDGNIAKSYMSVDPKTNAEQIIKDLKLLQTA